MFVLKSRAEVQVAGSITEVSLALSKKSVSKGSSLFTALRWKHGFDIYERPTGLAKKQREKGQK